MINSLVGVDQFFSRRLRL